MKCLSPCVPSTSPTPHPSPKFLISWSSCSEQMGSIDPSSICTCTFCREHFFLYMCIKYDISLWWCGRGYIIYTHGLWCCPAYCSTSPCHIVQPCSTGGVITFISSCRSYPSPTAYRLSIGNLFPLFPTFSFSLLRSFLSVGLWSKTTGNVLVDRSYCTSNDILYTCCSSQPGQSGRLTDWDCTSLLHCSSLVRGNELISSQTCPYVLVVVLEHKTLLQSTYVCWQFIVFFFFSRSTQRDKDQALQTLQQVCFWLWPPLQVAKQLCWGEELQVSCLVYLSLLVDQ